MNRESERIMWYQSGRAAIAFYFCFLVISALILVGPSRLAILCDFGRRLRCSVPAFSNYCLFSTRRSKK